jgi:hypothetical protein
MKKQETLDEAAENYAKQFDYAEDSSPLIDFIEGAKWQAERMYSEEDMQEYAEFCIRCDREGLPCIVVKDWFEQFKKK